jgi:hypothetical protein
VDPALLALLDTVACRRPNLFGPHELAAFIWGAARLGWHPAAWLQRGLLRHVVRRLPLMCPGDLSMAAWGLGRWARLGALQREEREQVADAAHRALLQLQLQLEAGAAEELPAARLAELAAGVADLGRYRAEVVEALCQWCSSGMRGFLLRDLAQVLWACARLRHDAYDVVDAAAERWGRGAGAAQPAGPELGSSKQAALLLRAYASMNRHPNSSMLALAARALALGRGSGGGRGGDGGGAVPAPDAGSGSTSTSPGSGVLDVSTTAPQLREADGSSSLRAALGSRSKSRYSSPASSSIQPSQQQRPEPEQQEQQQQREQQEQQQQQQQQQQGSAGGPPLYHLLDALHSLAVLRLLDSPVASQVMSALQHWPDQRPATWAPHASSLAACLLAAQAEKMDTPLLKLPAEIRAQAIEQWRAQVGCRKGLARLGRAWQGLVGGPRGALGPCALHACRTGSTPAPAAAQLPSCRCLRPRAGGAHSRSPPHPALCARPHSRLPGC